MADAMLPLPSKLAVPRPPRVTLPRPHLLRRLDEPHRLVIVSATAGSGKTTLIAEWVRLSASATAWLRLEKSDSEIGRFLAYLAAALRPVCEQAGLLETNVSPLHDDPNSQTAAPPTIHTLLAEFVRAVNEAANTRDIFLVLDDYHTLETDSPVHELVTFLIDHLPEAWRIVLIGRAAPPLALAKMRAGDRLLELDGRDLNLARDEAAAYLAHNLPESLELADDLYMLTEGWLTGLRLAAHAIKTFGQTALFSAQSSRFLREYFDEEVFEPLPETLQNFLLHTAILDTLDAPICAAVTGMTVIQAQALLAQIERANLFLRALDDDGQRYRYHGLFKAYLNRRFQERRITAWHDLQRRAALWYEEHNAPVQALDHAFACDDPLFAAALLERCIEMFLLQSQWTKLHGWLQKLPTPIIETNAHLLLIQAWLVLQMNRDIPTAETLLERAARLIVPKSRLEVIHNLIAGLVMDWSGQHEAVIPMLEEAVERLQGERSFWYGAVLYFLGHEYTCVGKIDPAVRTMTNAIRVNRDFGATGLLLKSIRDLGMAQYQRGLITQALHTFEMGIGLYEKRADPCHRSVAASLHSFLASLHLGAYRLERARFHIEQLMALLEGTTEGYDARVAGYLKLETIYSAQGDEETADQMMLQAERVAYEGHLPLFLKWIEQHRVSAAITRGEYIVALRWAESLHVTPAALQGNAHLGELDDFDYLNLARLWTRLEQHDSAIHILTMLATTAEQQGCYGNLVEDLLLLAVALHRQGSISRAIETFERVLTLCDPAEYALLFIREGPLVLPLLQQAGTRGIASRYIGQLLRAIPDFTKNTVQPLNDPLSDRELEILRLMAVGMSNEAIADQLIIAPSTVKWHVRNICGKLHSENRTQAVARARELRMLS